MAGKKCPKCGGLTEVDGRSCSCGWSVGKPREAEIDHQCGWFDASRRCETFGHLSNTTHGHGPWYCGTHFWKLNGSDDAMPIASKQQAKEWIDDIRHLVASKTRTQP